jgi:N-acetylglucosaminyl-diphospho-decaprenol L-rhamnosyltransferase
MTDETKKTPPRILTVIVNYRTADLVIEHFDSLAKEYSSLPGSSVVIVDNASPGGADAPRLQAFAARPELKGWVKVIASPENLGFAQGNNLAIVEALAGPQLPDYVFLLNPDAHLRPGALLGLLDFMEKTPEAGIAGPRLESESGEPHSSAFRFFSIAGEFEDAARTGIISRLLSRWRVAPPPTDETRPTDWICGAAVLIRREVFEEVGLFDGEYFLYYEETDFMLQAARKGWRTWYAPSNRVVHMMGRSSGVINGKLATRLAPDYWYQSRAYYFRKNHGRTYAFAADLAWMAGALLYYARSKVTGAKDPALWTSIRRFAKSQFGGGLEPRERVAEQR